MRLQGAGRSDRVESTAEKAAAEFARAEDPEQRAADPRIRKMQEISRQKGEKWASYKRNGSGGKLAHDDVAGTARADELTNVGSIAVRTRRDSSSFFFSGRGALELTRPLVSMSRYRGERYLSRNYDQISRDRLATSFSLCV